MKRNFHYVMLGAGVTVLVFLGGFALLFSQAQADGVPGPVSSSPAGELPHDVTTATGDGAPGGQNNEDATAPSINDDTPALPAESPIRLPGTPDDPETDANVIVHTVKELAQRQEAYLLGQAGWLHVESRPYIPKEQKGDGIHSATTDEMLPRETLVPDAAQYHDWYHVDETGTYHEAMALVTAPDNATHQQSILVGNQWVNLTLRGEGFTEEEYESPNPSNVVRLPASRIADLLDEMQQWKNISMEAFREPRTRQYVVVVTRMEEKPVLDGVLEATVLGGRQTFVFDADAGHLLSEQVELLLKDGTWILRERWDYPTREFLEELPVEVAQLYDAALNALMEGK